jgi:hypothetical protein
MLALPAPIQANVARRPAAVAAAAGLLVLGFVLLRLLFATSLGGFVVASRDFVDPVRTPEPLPVVTATGGYDGQFVYRFAVDPWTATPAAHGILLDNPAYRQQRIGTPVLAWIVALLPGVPTTLALVLVNAAALVLAAWYASRLATGLGRHPAWGLVLAFPACMPISLGRDLTEPVAWAALLAGLWYVRGRRWAPAAAALTVAVLARETSLVVVAGLVAGEAVRLFQARRTAPALSGTAPALSGPAPSGTALPAPPGAAAAGVAPVSAVRAGAVGLLLPIAVGVGWQVVLAQIWGSVPLRSGGSGNLNGLPLLGVFGSLFADLPDFVSPSIASPAVGAVVFVERFALLALFCLAGLAIVRRRSQASVGEAVAWALSVALALSLRSWSTDVQFLRAANEAVGLSLLIALGDPGRTGRLARWLGAALVLGVALEYAVRQ